MISALAHKCGNCGKGNSVKSVYCYGCGHRLHPLPVRPPVVVLAVRRYATPLEQPPPRSATPIEQPPPRRTAYVPTGIEGLDSMIDGGVPRSRTVLLCGEPGTGKTTMALQFLLNGYNKFSEQGLFVSLDESKDKLLEDTDGFQWNLRELVGCGQLYIMDASPSTDTPFSIDTLVARIKEAAKKLQAKRIAIDPLTCISTNYPDVVTRRRAVSSLFQALTASGATCLVTSELREERERSVLLEEYLSDGILRLGTVLLDRRKVRVIQVDKMRGTRADDYVRHYAIGINGIQVFSETAPYAPVLRQIMEKDSAAQ